MGVYQYSTEQLKQLARHYQKKHDPALDFTSSFIFWLSEADRKPLLKVQRWAYGKYQGQRIDECNDIDYLGIRIRNTTEESAFKEAMQQRLLQLLDNLK